MRSLLWGALAVAVGVVVATSLDGRATTERHSDLLPDARVVHYRFAIDAGVDDAPAVITALEARVMGPVASPFEMAELAELYLRRGDLAAARAQAERSLAILRSPNPSLLVLAKVRSAQHDFHGAIALAREQLAHKPTAAAYNVLATSYLALGDLPAAGEAADAALAIKPDSGGYLMRALVMQAQGRDAEAGFDFTRAAATEEHDARAESARLRALWARFLLRRGELAGARMLLAEALRISPGLPLATALRGELALRSGDARTARARFEEAFVASGQLRYLMDEARAIELGGDRDGATALRDRIEKLLRTELAERGVGHRLELVELLVDRGRPADLAEALALARAEVAARPSVDARFQLARVLVRTADLDGAAAQIRAALATGGREAQLYELASQLEQRRGNGPRAELYAREAAKLDPGDSGWRQLAAR